MTQSTCLNDGHYKMMVTSSYQVIIENVDWSDRERVVDLIQFPLFGDISSKPRLISYKAVWLSFIESLLAEDRGVASRIHDYLLVTFPYEPCAPALLKILLLRGADEATTKAFVCNLRKIFSCHSLARHWVLQMTPLTLVSGATSLGDDERTVLEEAYSQFQCLEQLYLAMKKDNVI